MDAFVAEVEVDASAVEEEEASNFATERGAEEEELELELEEVLESALASALLGSAVLQIWKTASLSIAVALFVISIVVVKFMPSSTSF